MTEFAQVGSQEQGQQDVSARPAHEVHPAGISQRRDDPCHGNERGGAHPVRRRGHAVGRGRDALARYVKSSGVRNPASPGNDQVEPECGANKKERPGLHAHDASPWMVASSS